MSIADKNTGFSIVIDRGLKHKLQILANSDKRSLGNYIASILESHVTEFEESIVETYSANEFLKVYDEIFGNEFETYLPEFRSNVRLNIQDLIKKHEEFKRGKQRSTKSQQAGRRATREEIEDKINDDMSVNDQE